MILDCPSCHARFKVADSLIPEGGRVVRCSRCAHEWHTHVALAAALQAEAAAMSVPHDAPAAEADVSAPSDDFFQQLEAAMGSDAAVVKPYAKQAIARTTPKRKPLSVKPFKIAAPLIAALWLVTALITYSPTWVDAPVVSKLYQAMGAEPTAGLVFSDVSMEREQSGSKTKFILAGSIRNHTNAPRAVPTVRVSLRDKTNKAIWGREYPVNTQLKAGEVYPFRISNVETSFASNVSSIVVDMGNPLQLLVR